MVFKKNGQPKVVSTFGCPFSGKLGDAYSSFLESFFFSFRVNFEPLSSRREMAE